MADERQTLLHVPAVHCGERRLRVQRLRDQLREAQLLRHVERDLDDRSGCIYVAAQKMDAAELGGERRDIGIGRPAAEELERRLEPLDRLLELTLREIDLAEACGDSCRVVSLP